MARRDTTTGGRAATDAVVPGVAALSIGFPTTLPEPDGFKWTALSTMARLESGHTPSRGKPEYWDGDIPWIGIRDATGNHGRVIADTEQHVTQLGIDNSSARVLPADTVCLSRTASVGYVVQTGRPMATSQDFVNWVCGPELNPAFLRYLLMSEAESIRRFAYGSVHATMYYPDAKALHVLLPSRAEQRAIAEVLGALDDKIAANAALAKRADELMHRTFRSLTPANDVPLSATAEFVNGKAFTKDASGTGRVVVRIAELNGGIGASTVFSDAIVDDKHVARPGDVLFAWSGSLTLHRWFRNEAIVNQHIFKVIPRDGYPAWLVYELVRHKLADFKAIAADKATTMGHIQRHHLDETVGIPSACEIDRLDAFMSALWGAALNTERESLTLAATRDALLPKLMSGKLRVRDAEAAASEAGA